MLLNPGKRHYMCLGNKTEKAYFSFDGKIFENSQEKTFWVLLKAINALFIIPLKGFEKRLIVKSWFCQEFHFTYNNSHKLLRPSHFLKNFLEILK